jgi:ribonuclease P protein component
LQSQSIQNKRKMISKNFRLNKSDTSWVLKKGEKLSTDLFIVRLLRLPQQNPQTKPPQVAFTIVTSTKLSKKAVERNALKRQISEALRLNINKVKNQDETWKVALIPKKKVLHVEYKEIESDIILLINKLNNE